MKAGTLAHAISFFPEDDAASTSSVEAPPAALTPKALAHARTAMDYEFGKVFDKHDADRYFGGMRGMTVDYMLSCHNIYAG